MRRARLQAAAGAALVALLAIACGGNSGDQPEGASTSATATASSASTSEATPAPTTAVTPTPTATQAASPTNPLPVALADLGGITGQACERPENAGKPCVELQSTDVTVRGGIAVFGVSSGGGGSAAVYGRNSDGEWKLWFRTQNAFSLLFLPGDVRICADGDGLNVRSQASLAGPVVTTLADETVARAEEFVLDTAGANSAQRGFGWYRLTAPVEGWAHSEFLAAAAHGDCALRDAQIGSAGTATAGTPAGASPTATPANR
ncbi:MAG: SH3 domain-containing protein [Dehalococcoidia bacterium]